MWPAIWMLPTEEYYGPWPTSGEIDVRLDPRACLISPSQASQTDDLTSLPCRSSRDGETTPTTPIEESTSFRPLSTGDLSRVSTDTTGPGDGT
jgi:hypothetical protein